MINRLKQFALATAIITASFVGLLAPQAAYADDTATGTGGGTSSGGSGINVFSNCSSTGTSGKQICGAAQQDDFNKLMTNIINAVFVVLGMIAVIMIVVGGVRYTTSNGEASQIKSAKDTILYAIVGLVVAILAYAIVNFILSALKK